MLWFPILKGSFVQLISTLTKSCYHCAYFLRHFQHYYLSVVAIQWPPKIEQIVAADPDLWCHYRSFVFPSLWLHWNWCWQQMKEHVTIINSNLTLCNFWLHSNQFCIGDCSTFWFFTAIFSALELIFLTTEQKIISINKIYGRPNTGSLVIFHKIESCCCVILFCQFSQSELDAV